MIVDDPTSLGPQRPVTPAPPRIPGSVRRTSTIDTFRPGGFDADPHVVARARDVSTDVDGAPHELRTATIDARLERRTNRLLEIHATPGLPALRRLLGATVGPGFRKQVDGAVPELVDTGDLLYLLLDDLPGATLVAGYAIMHAGVPHLGAGKGKEHLLARTDMCAGWARDGVMMRLVREDGPSGAQGPPAPPLARPDDPDAWHLVPALAPHAMRRLRRIDVGPRSGTTHPVDVFFRDSHVDGQGNETVVHEYSVTATVDVGTRTIVAIDAAPDVLPWPECPGAVGSATRLVGHPLAGLRPRVRKNFVGTSTCTHLNDVLRGLTDVDPLIDELLEATASSRGQI